jgi:hypothetical protein
MPLSKKPAVIRNAISQQLKTSSNSLTIQEWNEVINILKQQTNLNSAYLETLHRALFYDYDTNSSGTIPAFDNLAPGAITDILDTLPGISQTLEAMGIDIDALGQALTDLDTTLNTTIDNLPSFFYGATEPPVEVVDNGDLWYDTATIPNNIVFDDPADTIVHDDSGVGSEFPTSPVQGDEWIKLS